MSDDGPAARDEDVLVIPDSWLEEVIPRRGGRVPVPKVVPSVRAGAALGESLKARLPEIRQALENPSDDRDLAEAGLAYLDGVENPVGAAVVAHLETVARMRRRSATDPDWVDRLVVEHGLPFAACAFAEIDAILIDTDDKDPQGRERPVSARRYIGPRLSVDWAMGSAGRRMRALLAAADDAVYGEAVRALEAHRGEELRRLVTSFLVPSRIDWVDEICARPPERWAGVGSDLSLLLWCSLSTADQVEMLGDWAVLPTAKERLRFVLATLADGLGAAAAPILARTFGEADIAWWEPEEALEDVLEALSWLPGDEAFRGMGAYLSTEGVLPKMESMIDRFPGRAMRLLPELSAGTSRRAVPAAGLLRAHLRARPDLAARIVPELDEEARAVVHAVQTAVVPEAPADQVPEPLRAGREDALLRRLLSAVRPDAMPQVLLRGRKHALPAEATRRLVETLFAAPREEQPPRPLQEVLDALDRVSLADFGWSLFERLRLSGSRLRCGRALAWIADDETARRLGGLARSWSGKDDVLMAEEGLEALAAMSTDVAVMQLHLVAENARLKRLRRKARKLLVEVAEARGLTMEQLGDLIVPDFGLDADGGMTLDYGPRRFRVGFDEQLRPVVFDDKGKRRKALPRPGVRDDPELAPAAYRAFTGLKKAVRAVAADQVRRLERAMVEQRSWTVDDFQRLFVEHPLLRHLGRRLVWLHDSGPAFRIAEDRSFADVTDETVTLPDEGAVRVVHPAFLGTQTAAWADVFADYEIVQPFPQLGRPVVLLTEEERAGDRLTRFEGRRVGVGGLLALERQGWERGTPHGAGIQRWMTKAVPGGVVVLEVSPGFPAAAPAQWEAQTLGSVWINDSEPVAGDAKATFGDLDAVTASELLLTLGELAAPS